MTRVELGKEAFNKGYSCAQSVVLAFKNDINIDENILVNIAGPFGAGVARSRNVCGVISGMSIIFGLICGKADATGNTDKSHIYGEVSGLINQFEHINHTIVCKELLQGLVKLSHENPEIRTEEYKKQRPCIKFVEEGITILENYLIENDYVK